MISLSKKKTNPSLITVSDIVKAQEEWAAAIIKIGKDYTNKSDYIQTASKYIDQLYGYNYENGVVLFKPTKAKETPFRKTHESALSYFVGNNEKYKEDKGFALQPWSEIEFHNEEIYFHGDMAFAMGSYIFTDIKDTETTVEFTFGYVKNNKFNLKIVLHHSSLTYEDNPK